MGAVREQGLLAHESDLDLCFDSSHWAEIERRLVDATKTIHYAFEVGDSNPPKLFFSCVNDLSIDFWTYTRGEQTTAEPYQMSLKPGGRSYLLMVDNAVVFPLRA